MAKKLKETYRHTDIQTDRLPLVGLSAAVAAKNKDKLPINSAKNRQKDKGKGRETDRQGTKHAARYRDEFQMGQYRKWGVLPNA